MIGCRVFDVLSTVSISMAQRHVNTGNKTRRIIGLEISTMETTFSVSVSSWIAISNEIGY